MEKKRNLWVIPTDKPSRLILYSRLLNEFRLLNEPIEDWKHKKNICITSDEEIKEGDWILFQNVLAKALQGEKFSSKEKIILTTDTQLIKDGVQAIDDDFLEWFVKNPSCEEVEIVSISRCCARCYVYDDLCVVDKCCDDHHEYGCEICYGKKIDYKIIIPKEEPKCTCKEHDSYCCQVHGSCPTCVPKEEPKQEFCDNCNNEICCCIIRTQETLKEAAEREYPTIHEQYQYNAFIEGAKWQQKRMYSEEEVKSMLQKRLQSVGIFSSEKATEVWFKQYKKQ